MFSSTKHFSMVSRHASAHPADACDFCAYSACGSSSDNFIAIILDAMLLMASILICAGIFSLAALVLPFVSVVSLICLLALAGYILEIIFSPVPKTRTQA